jgi:hypothetical protein
MYSLYKNEYGIFQPDELTIRRENKIERSRIEEMSQFRL